MPTSRAKDLADFIAKQSTGADDILETGAMQLPAGTTGERPTAVAGMIRYNSTTSLSEYYDGTTWKAIDSPPVVSSISPTTESDANANIVITGSGFSTSVTVKFVGNDGTEYASPTVTRNSATQITAQTPNTALSVANEPYDIVVTNNSGLAGTLADALDAGGVPAFTTAAGAHSIYDSGRGGTFDAGATDPDGDTITYSVTAGSLPAGASINSGTGAITGFSAVGSNTTSTFTVSAATSSDTSTRQFAITVHAPVITSYTSTGSGTFSVPTGLTTLDVLVVAGGGAGGNGTHSPGGGGGGGLIYRPAFPVTPGGSVSYTVGTGGQGQPERGDSGQNSVFGTLTAQGGGGAGGYDANNNGSPPGLGRDGGSGGGGGSSPGQASPSNVPTGQGYAYPGGSGTQPQQPGDSGTYGFGNPGGDGGHDTGDWEGGGGGGGAGGRGSPGNPGYGQGYTADSAGGNGKNYSISGSSVGYAGGGGGGGNSPGPAQHGGGQGSNTPNGIGTVGTANRGGGGGGSFYRPSGNGAPGGSGIVIISY